MKAVARYVALLLLAALAASGVLQYHHHDCLGEVRIAINGDTDLLLGPSHAHRAHCEGHRHHGRCGSRACGLHLSQAVKSAAQHMATTLAAMPERHCVLPPAPARFELLTSRPAPQRLRHGQETASPLRAPPVLG